jgi:hypothetical protein
VLERVFPVSLSGDGGTETAPVALTVFFGANDACLPDRCSGFQHVPLHEYKENLRSIVSFFKVTYTYCNKSFFVFDILLIVKKV